MYNKIYRSDFDNIRSNKYGGFNKHILMDHNQWNYIHFLANIKSKDPTEFNGTNQNISF